MFLKGGTIPDPRSTDNYEFNIVQTIIKIQLKGGEMYNWNIIANACMGVSEETSTVVHHLYIMDNTGTDRQK